MAGHISDDKERDGTEEKTTSLFSTSGYGQKGNEFLVSIKKALKIYAMQSLLISVYTIQPLQLHHENVSEAL